MLAARARALRRRAPARLRLPGRRAVPRPAHARLRQRHQRAGDRLRPRAASRPSCPPSASRATSSRRSWTASRRTGSGTRTSARCERRGLPRDGARPHAARARRARGRQSRRLRRARAGRGHPRRRPLAVPGLPRAGRGRPHRVPAGHRRDRRPPRHLRGRRRASGRRDHLRDGLRARPAVPAGDVRALLGPRLAPAPAHAAPGPPRLRRHRAVPGAGAVLPAARAAGALDRRHLGGRGRAAGRGAHAPRRGRARPAAGPAQPARRHAGRGARRRARPARPGPS